MVWIALCALAAPAAAQPAEALKRAQAAFDQAQLDYLAGKYDEAAKGFQDAFAARDFPQFLYNAGACFHMKGKRDGSAEAYTAAVAFYRRYLTADPKAADKAKVEKAIGVLESEIKRLKDQAPPAAGATPPPASAEVQSLGDVKPRSLVVIESEPSSAKIYLDDKKKGPFGTTPWSGSLEGTHKVIIEKRGFMVSESEVTGDPNKLFVLRAVLGKEDFLGWVDVTSNVPGADVYVDDKAVGAVARTPYSQNMKPGKHTFWITAEGYDEVKIEVEVVAGQTHEVKANLKGAPVGKISIIGLGIEDSRIYIDGKLACEQGRPCSRPVPEGEHTVRVERSGMKPYQRRISIQAKTDTTIKVSLAPKAGRGDAIVTYILAAGFGGAGAFLGTQANKIRDELRKEIDAGTPPVDTGDDRFTKGKIYAIAADAAFLVAGISALTAIYYTFRDKGPPSTGLLDVRSTALQPQIGPGYAGLGWGVTW